MQWLVLILLAPYLYLLLKIYFRLVKIKPFRPDSQSNLFVSVIVACRNEEKNLPLLLSDIAAQDYNPCLFELIIIDDNSDDSTYKYASEFSGINELKVLRNKGSGKKSAIKTGVESCRGKLIVTTDADCRLSRSWMKTVSAFWSQGNPGMVIGPVMLQGENEFLQKFQELEFLSLQGITAGTAAAGNPVMCNGANLAFSRQSYLSHSENLHPEKVSGDDIFLLQSMKKENAEQIMWLESFDSIAVTPPCTGWKSFFRQRARWISKSGAYSDPYARLLAIVTFVTILIFPGLLIAGIFDQTHLIVLAGALLLKSIPDYLILSNVTMRYGKKDLMKWFLPSQVFYPFYVLRIVAGAVIRGNRWN